MLFAVAGSSRLLQDNPAFARSLLTRTPYIDPLNHLQVAQLEHHRAGNSGELVKRAIHLTINQGHRDRLAQQRLMLTLPVRHW